MLFFMKNISEEESKWIDCISGYKDLATGYIIRNEDNVLINSKELGSTNKTDTVLFGGVRRLGINHVFNG